MQNPNVQFCGYSIPHPAEDQMFIRIQTNDSTTAQEALKKGLRDLKEMCQTTKKMFNEAVKRYDSSN